MITGVLTHVVASCISLAATFYAPHQKSSRAHSAAPPFQIGPASPGSDLGMTCGHLKCKDQASNKALLSAGQKSFVENTLVFGIINHNHFSEVHYVCQRFAGLF